MKLELTWIDVNQLLAALEMYKIQMRDRELHGHADEYQSLIENIRSQKDHSS